MDASKLVLPSVYRAYEAILEFGFSPTEAARLALPVVKGTPVEEAVAIALSVIPMSGAWGELRASMSDVDKRGL